MALLYLKPTVLSLSIYIYDIYDIYDHGFLTVFSSALEGLLLRRAVRITAEAGGAFDGDAIVKDYVDFMTTPGSHNDTYCGTCHRMFFANRKKEEGEGGGARERERGREGERERGREGERERGVVCEFVLLCVCLRVRNRNL